MAGHAVVAILTVLSGFGAGCGSTPAARFYTLSSIDTRVTAASNLLVAVGPVSIPAVVDRPQIVVTTGAHELRLDELHRWASPLEDNLARVVAENLAAMLGTPRVMLLPQASSANPEYRVAIEVLSFASSPGKLATLDAVWTVARASDGKSETGRTSVHEKVPDDSYEALAAAHSRAVSRLSQDIADVVRAMDRAPH